MNNKGQTGAVEAIIIIILIVICGFLAWLLFSKKSEITRYEADSKPKVTSFDVKPGFGGCANVHVIEMMEAKAKLARGGK